jgi:carboxymethylenebutenolidase
MDLLKTFDPEASLRDGQDFLDFLSAHKDVRSGPVAVTGYCMGGSMAIRMAARYPENIATAASFHAGRLATDAPNSPHLLAAQIRARLYFGHAEKDASLPPEQIQHLEDALDAAGVTYSSEVYKGCAHGFCMLDLPAGNRHAVEQHWSKLFALLGQSL